MTVGEQMVSVIKAVINNEKTDIGNMDIDWEEMWKISSFHGIANIIAYAVDESVPEPARKKFSQAAALAAAASAKQEYETKKILGEFEKNGISYMLLKGYVMKNFYMCPEMRTMCDVDILVKAEDTKKIESVMCSLEYKNKNLERDDETTYQKPPFCSYEMHTQLVSSTHTIIDAYYGNGWKFAEKDSDNGFGYHMSHEDFFVFMIAHFTKHYTSAGVGIRPVIDMYIYLQRFKDVLDRHYIDGELEKLGFKEFAYNIFELAEFWFGNGKASPKIADIANYVLSSGIYGTNTRNMTNRTAREKNVVLANIKHLFNNTFLNYKNMTVLYPRLKKQPFFIAYYWVKRLITKLFDGSAKRYIRLKIKTGGKAADKMKAHFIGVGLDKFC